MLTTIKGFYDQGKITLTEPPPVKTKTDVFVTFLNKEKSETVKKLQSRLGGLEGKITVPDNFDEPLDDLKEYMY